MSFTRCNCESKLLYSSREVSAISYNIPGYITRGPYRTARPKKKYQYNIESWNRYLTIPKTKMVCLSIAYMIIGYY
jgi:hypothetical protein